MKSHLRTALCVTLSAILAFGAPAGALAATLPERLEDWVGFKAQGETYGEYLKNIVLKFGQYNDFFCPELKHGSKLFVQAAPEKDGVATLKESDCTLAIEEGRIWNSYFALCEGRKLGLTKPMVSFHIPFTSNPKVVVQGPPEQVKTDPKIGTGTTNPKVGTGDTNPKVGTGDTDPQIGTGDTNPKVGTGDTNPKVGTGDTNPTTVKKTPFDEAVEKLATLFTGKKVPPAVIEFLAGKDESTKSAFVEWMKKAETTAESLLAQYKILDEVVGALLGKNAPMLTWLSDKKQIAEKDLLQFLCPETEKTSMLTTVVKSSTVMGQAGNIATGNGNFDDNTNTVVTAPTGSSFPKEILDKCDALKKQQALDDARNTPTGDPNTLPIKEVPSLTAGEQKGPAISPDVEEKKKDDAKKKSDLARSALGGAYGAVAFGILGMIFGGPFGLVIGAMVGFGLVGGMTYLNNNKIK